jgi:putative phosphoesterase
MRIAALADIHGNLRALEAVQADLSKRAPDIVVNLGDHLSGPLQAAATADLLMQESYITIRGNHDRQLIDRDPPKMGPSDRAARVQLTERHLAWLAELPPIAKIEGDVLLCHGSPSDDLQYLLEKIEGNHVRLADSGEICRRLGAVAGKLILCGHTHIPRIVALPGGLWVVNPGSVGLQAYDDTSPWQHYMETGSPHARYAIIDWHGNSPRVEFIAVAYDWEAAAKEAAQAGRADWANALATGCALRVRS